MARNETASELTTNLGVDPGAKAFVVQTNYDRSRPDPASDPRRSRGAMLASMERAHAEGGGGGGGGGLDVLDLFATASAYPVHNPHTAYTAAMDPAAGTLSAYVRDAMCPTDPALARAGDARCCSAHE